MSYPTWIILFLFLAPPAFPAQWYVWQRQWSDEVIAAAKAVQTKQEPLYLLHGELEIQSGQWQWRRIAVPEDFRTEAAVLRAPAAALAEPERLLDELTAEIKSLEAREIQLDIDVPERMLAEYARLLEQLKARFPDRIRSVTLLPCHLDHAECAAILAAVDFWVLQLHGLNPPGRRDVPYALMDPAVVEQAIRQARIMSRSFRIALPTYAYILRFHADGSLDRLYAEAFSGDPADPGQELAAPDLPLIAAVIRANPDLPVVWFRLPVQGDRWNLARETVDLLDSGAVPEPELELVQEITGRQLLLSFRWRHQIPRRGQSVKLALPPEWRDGECFLLNGATADNWSCGAPPPTLVVPPAPCGEKIPVALITRKDPLP